MMKCTLLVLTLLSLVSCISEPEFAVDTDSLLIRGDDIALEEELSLSSVVYEGFDLVSRSCGLAITTTSDSGEQLFIVKLYYTLHGQSFSDIALSPYKYDISQNLYRDIEGQAGDDVLAGAYVRDILSPDINMASAFEEEGSLQYMLRVTLDKDRYGDFLTALEGVVGDPSTFEDRKGDLNVINSIAVIMGHVGHYDRGLCTNFSLVEMKEVNYEFTR